MAAGDAIRRSGNPPARSKIRAAGLVILFITAALLIHALPLVLFRVRSESAPDRSDQRKQHCIAIRTNDLKFRKFVSYVFASSDDPTAFISGGKTGYSLIRERSGDLEDEESQLSFPAFDLKNAGAFSPDTEPVAIPDIRTDAPIGTKMNSPVWQNGIAAKPSEYPLWADSNGVLLKFSDPENEQMTNLFRSKDITGPTELRIVPPDPEHGLPASAALKTSCGNTFLDLYAVRRISRILHDGNRADHPQLRGPVRIYWRKDLPVVSALANAGGRLFPDEYDAVQEGAK